MQITLGIPHTFYRELLNQAKNSNRSVEEIVLQNMALMFRMLCH